MIKSWLVTYNDETASQQNEKDYGWQNPIFAIEGGMTKVLTGSTKHIKNFEKGDIVYIYGGGKKRRSEGINGIYAIGTVESFLDDDKNYKFAWITIKDKGRPLINGSDLYSKLEKYLDIARLKQNRGYCKLDDEIIEFINGKL